VDSSEQSSLKEALAPFWAIMQADLKSLFKSKITYGWLTAAIFLQVIRVLGTFPLEVTSTVITNGLSDFIYIWSMLVIGIAASAVASETGALADSIMSKSVKRYEYILAKFSSRITYTIVTYLAITTVLIGASLKIVKNDYEICGLIASILLVALTLVMLTSVGVALSTVIPNTAIAIVILLVSWYSMTFFLPILDLEFLSPSNLMNQLPNIIQGIWNGEEWKTAISFAAIALASTALSTLYFSKKDL
jgi:putative exporter of polyketide antibiotics